MSLMVPDDRFRMFFVVGPLRTGTSLLARCLDDHPDAICLCESEINRALFADYCVEHHCQRMVAHGLTLGEAISFLDRKPQEDVESLTRWYSDVAPRLSSLYAKPEVPLLGDKSPDFYRSPALVRHLASGFPLIYTVRDPRAILRSIESQDEVSPQEKAERWAGFVDNYRAWRPYLDSPNVLVVRYEDLLTETDATMQAVYGHLNLPASTRYREPFARAFPERFLWSTAVDFETGARREFDPGRIAAWRWTMSDEPLLIRVRSDPTVVEFMRRFQYRL